MIPDAKLTTERLRALRKTLTVDPEVLQSSMMPPLDRLAAAACQFLCMAIDVEIEEREAKQNYARDTK